MILAIDIGNSNIVLGGYSGTKYTFISRVATELHFENDQYAILIKDILALYGVPPQGITGSIISSVVPPLTGAICGAVKFITGTQPIVFTKELSYKSIKVNIDNPLEIGNDIISGCLYVKNFYKLPAIVIDMGTATKLTAIDKDGIIQGVAIAPGLFLSLGALTNRASLLKGIELQPPKCVIGKNTDDSIKSGVILGSCAMLEGLCLRIEEEMATECTVVLTGGAARDIKDSLKRAHIFNETLLLDGLVFAYQNINK